ncbi:uncharacterized protein [Spinacia oleracea]|uniref:Uncharacterized protein LOC110801763 n=1 Tax=Spinacia oleracea TaxID=3562 RepID=A0A9R0K8Z3_SPIOL|nr:uncharacterized protein LOC110801763 [Spinacia oleracea]XP_056699261.1 uncharacterized protein LOC110801763 [Spinacia oleracea]XP_056699262.1 uncharacterized protein LOC110801763 [Spinacia oleracea]XP_056699263.1 uncharacterized protein LOC110801763 [Spinacia oleracea]XP_056699264.1 uncharacterized protein LOC110801763 [Spinacia oleracea]
MQQITNMSWGVNESYRPLPSLYLTLSSIWFFSCISWAFLTWRNRHLQTNNLQWTLASVPFIKTLQLMLSFLFWYSCFYSQICSLWMSFGVYVTGVLFQTASFVSFLLIAHGYCILCEHLSVYERRTTAALGCIFYLTLVGYRASVPYFTALLLLNYFISFSVIFHHISQNLLFLREQLSVIEDDDVRAMHDAVRSKYVMFKKFRVAMQLVALAEAAIYINVDDSPETYWIRLLVREWAQYCIFLYIGWTFRSQDLAPRFSVIPSEKSQGGVMVPPIFTVVMDAADYKDFSCQKWHIGVATSLPKGRSLKKSSVVIVQQPKS